MWKGDATFQEYCSRLSSGFCEKHLKEFGEIASPEESQELQRKTILYMRLCLLNPFLFGKPYGSKTMRDLATKCRAFPKEGCIVREKFTPGVRESVILFDSVTTFTLCFLSKICCAAGLFKESRQDHCQNDNFATFIHKIISAKKLTSEEINTFVRTLRKNFENFDGEFVKEANLMTLLFVRELRSLKLSAALQQLEADLNEIPASDSWRKIGNEQYSSGKYDQSISSYSSALQLHPYNHVVFSNRAQAYLKLNRYEEAELDSRASVTICPSWCKGYCRLVSSLLYQNFETEAWLIAGLGLENCRNSPVQAVEELTSLAKQAHEKFLKKQSESSFECIPNGDVSKVKSKILDKSNDVPDLTDSSSCESDPEVVEKVKVHHQNSKLAGKLKSETKQKPIITNKVSDLPRKEKYGAGDLLRKEQINEHKASSNKVMDLTMKQKFEESESLANKREELFNTSKEGSTAMSEGCGDLAMGRYFTVLNEVKKSPSLYQYDESDLVHLKYVYGSACVKSGTFEDLHKSINTFKEIVEEHTDVTFPAAYYGLGLAYCKLNRFKEATIYLEKLYSFLQKGILFKVYNWPGTISVIEETKPATLKRLTEELINKCSNPPAPDAICRFESCVFNPPIYYTDPDFKGFLSILCSEHCLLRYHPACWKLLKSVKYLSDKEYLDHPCLTPDCLGTVLKVECIGKDGSIEKIFLSEEFDKGKKLPKQKKSKLEKKLEIKEQRRRMRNNSLTLSSSKSDTPETTEVVADVSVTETVSDLIIDTERTPAAESQPAPTESQNSGNSSGLSVNAEPFIVLKKEASDKDEILPKAHKQKDRKKGSKKTKLSIDEFCGENFSYYNEYQARLNKLQESKRSVEDDQQHWNNFCQTERIPDLDPSRPFHIPEGLRNDPYTLDAVLQSVDVTSENKTSKTIKDTIYTFLEDILSYKGPLNINDPELIQELEQFPIEARKVINENGGFKDFMLKSMRFAIVKDYVCVIDDVIKAYDLSSKNQIDHNSSIGDELDYFGTEIVCTENGFEERSDDCFSYLNPEAIEYKPLSHQQLGSIRHSDSRVSETSLETNSSNCESESLLSVVNQLRQPIGRETATDMRKISSSSSADSSGAADANNAAKLYANVTAPAPSIDIAATSNKDPSPETNETMASKLNVIIKWLYSEEVTEDNRRQINQILKPYALVKAPHKQNKCVQAVIPQVEMISIGVMKDDDELQKEKELNAELQTENGDLQQVKLQLEEKLISILDSATKAQKKLTVDNCALKTELEDIKLEFQNQKEELLNKQAQSQSEIKHLQQLSNKAFEEVKMYKKDMEKWKSESEKQNLRIKELEDNLVIMNVEKESSSKYNKLQEEIAKEAKELVKKDLHLMEQRARNAEFGILKVKREEFLKRIDDKIIEAKKRTKEIQAGITSIGPNLDPYYNAFIKALLLKINDYISGLVQMRAEFVLNLDVQIKGIENGEALSDLKPIKIYTIPEVPSYNTDPNFSMKLPTYQPKAAGPANLVVNNSAQALPNPMLSAFNPFIPPNTTQQYAPQNVNFPTSGLNPAPFAAAASNFGHTTTINKIQPLLPCPSDAALGASKTQTPLPMPSASPEDTVQRRLSTASLSPLNEAAGNISELGVQSGRKWQSPVRTPSAGASTCSSKSSLTENSSLAATASVNNAPIELGYSGEKNKPVENIESKQISKTASVHSLVSQKSETRNCYNKLLTKLQNKHPNLSHQKLLEYVTEFRERRSNSLSGLKMDVIVKKIGEIIAMENKPKTRPAVLINKSLVSTPPVELHPQKPPQESPWAKPQISSTQQWSGESEDNSCIICLEEMSPNNVFRVDCGHRFHYVCIKNWLDKNSNCPTCRVHVLLPDDYPSLT